MSHSLNALDVLGSLPVATFVVSTDGRLIYGNERAEIILTKNVIDFQNVNWQRRIEKCLAEGEYQEACREFDCIFRLKRIQHGQAEPEILICKIEVETENAGVASAYQNIRLRELSEMAAGIAHEVNNPMTVVRARAEILLRQLTQEGSIDPAVLSAGLEKIVKQSSRVTQIIRGIRSFARDANSDPMAPVSLKSVMTETLALLNPNTRDFGVEIRMGDPDDSVKVIGRGSQLMQVFLNLLNNAIDATRTLPQAHINVTFEVSKEIVCRIWDNGSGIGDDDAPKIFQPFFTTKPPGSGTGIGLSIARKIVEDHAGTIQLNRAIANSCFEIRFPAMETASVLNAAGRVA